MLCRRCLFWQFVAAICMALVVSLPQKSDTDPGGLQTQEGALLPAIAELWARENLAARISQLRGRAHYGHGFGPARPWQT